LTVLGVSPPVPPTGGLTPRRSPSPFFCQTPRRLDGSEEIDGALGGC
jgi:hypothetical protein